MLPSTCLILHSVALLPGLRFISKESELVEDQVHKMEVAQVPFSLLLDSGQRIKMCVGGSSAMNMGVRMLFVAIGHLIHPMSMESVSLMVRQLVTTSGPMLRV